MVSTLLHQQGPRISFSARPSCTSDAQRYWCYPMLRHIEGAGGARWPRNTGWHMLPMVYEATIRPEAKGDGGSCCKRGGTGMIYSFLGTEHAMVSEFYLWDWEGTGTIHSLLGTEHVTVFKFYRLGLGRDSLCHFVYPGMARRSIAGIDRRGTTGNLTGGGGTDVRAYDGRGQCPG
ncbi:hypothetical protein GOBAR_AA11932 [Gossypium barbadense]|uniref:Uncharacterized protein n=1 Tax=Gossypium barbadense TaxID=3634 RepID=A0A2P5XZE4_GOSBA|nr:hypothetical protein GOBAR_AA11932 [Gossypium barbadense]